MAEDLRRVAELIDFWKKLDLRTFQRELKSVHPELKCLLFELQSFVGTRCTESTDAITSTASTTKEAATIDATTSTIAAVAATATPSSPSSSPPSSPSTLPPSPLPELIDPGVPRPSLSPNSREPQQVTSKDVELPKEVMPSMALQGLFRKIRKFFRVQDILSLLVNYGELLKLVEAVLGKQESYAKLQTFLTTNGRRGRRRSANCGHLKPRISTQKVDPDSASHVLPNSPDDVELCSRLFAETITTSGDRATPRLQYDLQAKQSDQSPFDMPSSKTPIGRYCPLTVPKYVPPIRSGMPSRPDITLSSVSNRSDVPSFDHHHHRRRYHHNPIISSSSSSSSVLTSFTSLPLPTSWTSFDTSASTNGHGYDGDEDYEDGDDDDEECMDLRIESKRLASPVASSSSSSSASIFMTSSSGKDGRQLDTQNPDLRGTTSEQLSKSQTWDSLSERVKMKSWLECDDVTLRDVNSGLENGRNRSIGMNLLDPVQQKQEQLQQHLVSRYREEMGGAYDLPTNGCEKTSESRFPFIHNRSVKRKRKEKSAGISSDSFRSKRFFPGREEHQTRSEVSGSGTTPVAACDSSNCRRNSIKEDDEKKKATKELISRIYMKELERLVDSAEKRGETVELQTYRDELEKIRKNLMTPGEKKVDGEGEGVPKSDDIRSFGGKGLSSGAVSVKSEDLFNIKTEKDDALDVNFIGGRMADNFETPDQQSPLQRIQSIFNSGIMRPASHSKSPSMKQSSGHHHGHHNRTALPPIDQHQLEANLDINTEELVKKVREFLGRFSISQRLFGEKVLGLSQGSVSDLLARPKPWCVLTQKGREPFARMKMFLKDQDGIMTRLLTSQCKVMTSMAMTMSSTTSVSMDDSKTSLDLPAKVHQPAISDLSGSTPSTQIHFEKLSAGKQPTPSLLNNPSPLKIPLRHPSSPRNSPKARSPWTTSAGTEALSSAGYLGNFPFSSFLPSVLSMIGNSGQTPSTNSLPPFLSPSPFFPLMVPGYPSIPAHANLLRNLPYRFPCERPRGEAPPNLGDHPEQHPNGIFTSSSRLDSNFHCDSPTFPFRNHQEIKRHADDLDDSSGRTIKEENISDSAELLEKFDENAAVAKHSDSTPIARGNDQQPSYTTPSATTSSNADKMKADYSFRDVHQFELDTQAITARVKELLQQSNLGQKLFGEAVLELSQGSVSELLSKPKPWTLLSLKGREPFIKMNAWLADPNGVEKLRNFHLNNGSAVGTGGNGCKGLAGGGGKTSKRKTASEADSPSSTSSLLPQQRVEGEKERPLDEEQKKKKRPRLFFTEEQKAKLRESYELDPYPSQMAIERLARELNVGSKTVVNWFHNHRMRAKQVVASGSNNNNSLGGGYGSIDDIIHRHIFTSALAFRRDGKSDLRESVEGVPSPLEPDDYKTGETPPEESENFSCHAGISNSSVSISFNKRKRSKPLKVPEVPVSQDTSSLTEPPAPSPSRPSEELPSVPLGGEV